LDYCLKIKGIYPTMDLSIVVNLPSKISLFTYNKGYDIIKTSLIKMVWLNVYHWYVMLLTLYIILSLWSLYRLLTIIWFPTVQWRLYNSTHCGLNKFVGTWNIHHRAMHDLKAYLATLTSSFFVEGFGLCSVWFTAAMRARLCSSPAPLSVCKGVLPL